MRMTMRNPRPAVGGFNLVELMVAMMLFSVIGVALVSLLSRSADFLTRGASAVETMDALQMFSEAFERDIQTLYTQRDADEGLPAVRMFSDHVNVDIDDEPDGKTEGRVQRLFFVRMIPDEATASTTRTAGTVIEAKSYLDQDKDAEEAAKGDLKPTGGLMEVFWTALATPGEDPAILTLYRGYRSPIGGEGSFMPTRPGDDPGATEPERGPKHRKEVLKVTKPVLGGVLYFGVDFWDRHTTTWDDAVKPGSGGPLRVWDSTRGILPKGTGFEGFFLAKERVIGEDGPAQDPTDDVFPRRVRVTLVVEQLGRAARTGVLAESVTTEARSIAVTDPSFIPPTEGTQRFVKIGAEWIRFEAVDGSRLTGCTRGVRGTVPAAHEIGVRVHHGRTVVREYEIPTYRDTYQEELPSNTGRGSTGR